MHTDGAGSRHPGRRAPPLAPSPQPGALRRFRAALRPSAGSALPLSLLRPARRWLRHFAGSAPAPGVAAPGGCAQPAAALRVPLILLETSQTIQHGKSVDNIGKSPDFLCENVCSVLVTAATPHPVKFSGAASAPAGRAPPLRWLRPARRGSLGVCCSTLPPRRRRRFTALAFRGKKKTPLRQHLTFCLNCFQLTLDKKPFL